MIIDFLSTADLIILDFILLLVILFFIFKWFFGQVRNISKEPEGFIKFGQITFILLSWTSFVIILIYFIIFPNQVNMLNIFLTIIVGFLGTSVGFFFGKEALESLKGKVKIRGRKMFNQISYLEDVTELIKENIKLKEQLKRFKKI